MNSHMNFYFFYTFFDMIKKTKTASFLLEKPGWFITLWIIQTEKKIKIVPIGTHAKFEVLPAKTWKILWGISLELL